MRGAKARVRGGPAAVACAALLAAAAGAARAEEIEKPQNLLRLPSARVESTTAPGGDPKAVGALADGDPATVASVAATDAAPLDVVYEFGGADVAPQSVRVVLPPKADGAAAARVEVLVSTVSAHAGFRSVRSDPLTAGKPNAFEFQPIGARWILVRLSASPGAEAVAAAEVEVLGHPGPPKSRYAFSESPAKALDVIDRLRASSSVGLTVTADERAVFAKAVGGRLDARGFAEAALLASGVTDPAARARYLARLDALEKEARAALASARTTSQKGEALLQWLHRGPMSKGYVAEQTDLSRVLDTGTFNCVSSAALYNCLALRLGLDARAIEVPTHAFSIVYDGTRHADVETTTPQGFDPARDPAKAAGFERLTGFRYLPDIYRDQRREVEEAGLAALVYYNHGVMLEREKRYHEALLQFFRAMSLDREFDSAVKGGLGSLANWGVELSKKGEYERALEVVGTGLALAPEDATLRNNRLVVWQQWSERAIDAGKPEEALAILRRAAEAVPDGGFVERQAWVYLKPGERLADAGKWEEAFAATAPGLQALTGKAREDLAGWRTNLHHRWFSKELREGRFEAAAAVIERGLGAHPGEPGLLQNAGYLAQEWSRAAGKDAPAKGLEVARAVVARFPAVESVRDAASSHVRRAAYAQVEAGGFEEALATLAEGKDLLKGEEEKDAGVLVHDRWAKARMAEGAWDEAADVYARALARWPDEGLLEQNVAYLGQEWSKAAYAKGGAPATADVAKRLAAKFPGIERLSKAGGDQLRRRVHELVQAGKFDEALLAVDEGKDLLGEPEKVAESYFFVYDRKARAEIEAGRHDGAAEVYAAGLARFPDHRALRGNVAWLAQEWAKAEAEKGDAAKAVAALRTMVARFPALDDVKDVAKAHVARAVRALADADRPEEALAAVEASKDLLPEEEDVAQQVRAVYDRWARGHEKASRWQEAADVYAKGLARLPDDRHLRQNAVATWYRWAKSRSDAKAWDEAVAVYDRALERFPGEGVLSGNRAWCLEQKAKGK